jgi:hypothetical protein
MKLLRFQVIALAVMIFALLGAAVSANAATMNTVAGNGTHVSASVSAEVQRMLRANPQAKLIAPNEVQVSPNFSVVVTPSLKDIAAGVAPAIYSCPAKNLCISDAAAWDQAGHYVRPLYYCGMVDLGARRYPDFANVGTAAPGPKWNDRLSSYNNNQTPGTVSSFYNWGSGAWHLVHTSAPAPSHVDDFGPLGINDIVDGVYVC